MPQTPDYAALARQARGAAPKSAPVIDYAALARQAREGARPATRTKPRAAEDYVDPPSYSGSALSRFGSNIGELLNPIAIAQGLYGAVRHPIDTLSTLYDQQRDTVNRGLEDFETARRSPSPVGFAAQGVGRVAAGLVPILGPIAARAGEQFAEGDIAGGAGKAAGLLLPFGAAKLVKRGAPAVTPVRVAEALEGKAARNITSVIAPKTNTNAGRRMGNKAAKLAPEIAKDPALTSAWSRRGLQQNVEAKLSESAAALDDVSEARLSARSFETDGVLADLQKRRAKLTAEPVKASQLQRTPTDAGLKAQPYGKSVVPAPNRAQVAQIDQAIQEIEALGPTATYEALRRIRASYDGPATTVYNPSMTADFLVKNGEARGAADVTGVLRDHLAKFDPETASANGNFHLYKSTSDILKATEEIERVRPKVGRKIAARVSGTVLGAEAAGWKGAAAGYVLGPILDTAVNAGVTTKLQIARLQTDLAAAIRKGDVGRVASIDFKLRQNLKQLRNASGKALTVPRQEPQPQGSR